MIWDLAFHFSRKQSVDIPVYVHREMNIYTFLRNVLHLYVLSIFQNEGKKPKMLHVTKRPAMCLFTKEGREHPHHHANKRMSSRNGRYNSNIYNCLRLLKSPIFLLYISFYYYQRDSTCGAMQSNVPSMNHANMRNKSNLICTCLSQNYIIWLVHWQRNTKDNSARNVTIIHFTRSNATLFSNHSDQ